MTVPDRRRRHILIATGAAAALLGVGAIAYVATGAPGPATTAARTSAHPACASALVKDWRDGRIDGTYPISCYRVALRSLPVDLQVYSSAPEDISQALSRQIMQSARQRTRNDRRPAG